MKRYSFWYAILQQLLLVQLVLLNTSCGRMSADSTASVLPKARLQVATPVLDRFVGTYRLSSGAHYHVVRLGQRLLGGTPPSELFAQTTRQFISHRLAGEFHFDGTGPEPSLTLRRRFGKHDFRCPRIDAESTPDPTCRVSAGGHDLRMLIIGTGSPTIVLEDGFGSGIEHQAELQAELSQDSTVVSYDHAGTGGSDAGPLPRDARRIARELRTALQSAGLPPPFLLIGGSIGGAYIRIFAHEFPQDTAGLILLDPTPEWDRLLAWAQVHAVTRVDMYRQFIDNADNMMDELMSVQEAGRAAEWAAMDATRAQARQAYPLPTVPVVQITGAGGRQTKAAIDDKIRFYDAWLQQYIPQAKHVLAHSSGHSVLVTDRKLVLQQVRELLSELRKNQHLALPLPDIP